ncbi:MAG TPA: hypothetical protein VNW06_00265, partial [Cytophagaceae bacterium]|nr:hypothetical protein [Cytophagaceae bacterium]
LLDGSEVLSPFTTSLSSMTMAGGISSTPLAISIAFSEIAGSGVNYSPYMLMMLNEDLLTVSAWLYLPGGTEVLSRMAMQQMAGSPFVPSSVTTWTILIVSPEVVVISTKESLKFIASAVRNKKTGLCEAYKNFELSPFLIAELSEVFSPENKEVNNYTKLFFSISRATDGAINLIAVKKTYTTIVQVAQLNEIKKNISNDTGALWKHLKLRSKPTMKGEQIIFHTSINSETEKQIHQR